MNNVLAGALIAALAATAGCSSLSPKAQEKNPAPCPNIMVLNEASRLIEFDGAETIQNVAYTGEITRVAIGCRYQDDKPINAEISVELAFGKGPKGEAREKPFKYFVAVTRKDLDVITKKEFMVNAKFNGEEPVVLLEQEIDDIIIPRAGSNISGVNFEIIVGFALTPEQVIFNRSGKSLKFPNLR